jgi:MSHA biogenesis protein MshP
MQTIIYYIKRKQYGYVMHPNSRFSKQSGFLLPIALVFIVVASGAALVVSKQLEKSALLSIDLILYNKSLYAAETGAQLGLNKLFFISNVNDHMERGGISNIDNNTNKVNHINQCETLNIDQVFSLVELKNCHIKVSCHSQPVSVDMRSFKIESVASCRLLSSILTGAENGAVNSAGDARLIGGSKKVSTQKVIVSRLLPAQ